MYPSIRNFAKIHKFILHFKSHIILLYIPVAPIISVNCSSVTTVNESDYFACECKGTDGNLPADVTWYKNNVLIVTGKEKAILRFTDVDKDDNGIYRCEAKSHDETKNETFMELIVNCEFERILINQAYFSDNCLRK